MVNCGPADWDVNISAKLGNTLCDTIEQYDSRCEIEINPQDHGL